MSSTSTVTGMRLRRGSALALLASSMFVIVLDSAMVNLAASAIRDGLALTAAETAAVANTYVIALAGLVLLGGRLADTLGARRMFLAGMALYVGASAVAALAPTGAALLAGRVGQGIGAAVTIPAALAMVLAMYASAAERTRAVGVWGAVAGAGSLVGVFAGGALTDVFGWRSVFWVPVPLGLAAAVLVRRTLPPVRRLPQRFDTAGAVSVTVGISALALGMVTAAEIGWTAPSTLIALAVALAAFVAFVAAERRASQPLVPLGVVRRPRVAIASAIVLLAGGTMTSLFFYLPLYQQDVLGMSALATGLAQVPIAVMIIVASALAPLLAGAVGIAHALAVSLAILLAGILGIALDPSETFGWTHLVAFSLVGTGLGLGMVNAMAMALRDSGEHESGLLSGLVNAAQTLGGAVGLAALTGIALGGASGVNASQMDFTATFLGGAGLVALALILAVVAATARRLQADDGRR